MTRIRFLASASIAPLLLLAGQALAETVISDTRTTPIATATAKSGAADDILVDSDEGEIELDAAGAAITVNSNNTVTNEGVITTEAVDGSIGILVQGGITTTVTNAGTISLVDDFDQDDDDNDADDDGDLDGDFAEGSGRYGIRVTSPGAVTGDIINDYSGSILVEGNDSWGISLETYLIGDLISRGAVSVTGDNARGIDIRARLDGDLDIMSSVAAVGENAVGVAVSEDVSGAFHLQGSVVSTGYRYTSRPSDEDDLAILDEDDLLQGGSAVSITASIAGGVMMDAVATATTDLDGDGIIDSADDDDDGDGILDEDDEDLNDDGITDDDYDDDGTVNSKDDDDDNDGVEDDDSDDDGVYDDDNGDGIPDNDLDQDGRIDAYEGASSIVSYGAAPALAIGSASRDITIGEVGTGDEAYALVMKGTISASGVFDGIGSTGLKIGGTGHATTMSGGLFLDGSVLATAYQADAQAIHLAAGADVGRIDNSGSIYALAYSGSYALSEEPEATAYAVRIDAGADLAAFTNSGTIGASVYGESNSAVAIVDYSGTLTSLTNSGNISAIVVADDDEDDGDDDNEDADDETVTGRGIALDLTAAQQGVTITQLSGAADRDSDGVVDSLDEDVDGDGTINDEDDDWDNDGVADDEDDDDDTDVDGDGYASSQEPSIIGDILLGAHEDTIDLQNGAISGDIAFGDGADSFVIGYSGAAAQFTGAISDSDGLLAIDVVNGELNMTEAQVVDATRLTLSATSLLSVTIDPLAGTSTRFNVDTASIATGSALSVDFDSLLQTATRFTIVHAESSLTVGEIDSSLEGESPYLYVAVASADATAGEVYVDVRRRTAEEMSLTANQTAALDAVYSALGADDEIRDAFLGAEDRGDFMDLYEQMLPDQGEGLFSTLDALGRTTARLTAARPGRGDAYGPDSFWIQEINTSVQRQAGVTAGSTTKSFGLIGGYESMGRDGGALGATLAFIAGEEKDDIAAVGEETSVALLEAGVYWRRALGNWTFNLRGAGAYAWLTGDRVFIDPNTTLIVEAGSEWTGYTGTASASLDYEARVGRYYVRPSLATDYIVFNEGERVESGGGDGFDQTVQERTSTRLSSTAALTFGATYGRDTWWRPELRLGYRQVLAGGVGDTVFRFQGGQWVTLPATEAGDGSMIVGISLRAGTSMSYFALEGEYEAADGEDLYNVMLAGRMIF